VPVAEAETDERLPVATAPTWLMTEKLSKMLIYGDLGGK
jgi:hypothetical protein